MNNEDAHTAAENMIMPKLLVLLYSDQPAAATLAESCVEGAKSVRFTEVDIRVGAAEAMTARRAHKLLESTDRAFDYDGVILVCLAAGDLPIELRSTLDAWEAAEPGVFGNTVFGVVGGDNTTLLARAARLGGIIVTEPCGISNPELRAKQLGSRVATVVSWVGHALAHAAHENSEHRGHHHQHDSEHRDAH